MIRTWASASGATDALYLGSLGSKCLNGKPTYLVGLSQETTCYVSTDYFDDEDPFADFVVHEAAPVFHNCKRERVLASSRRQATASLLRPCGASKAKVPSTRTEAVEPWKAWAMATWEKTSPGMQVRVVRVVLRGLT